MGETTQRRCALYLRVSTAAQVVDGSSLATQRRQFLRYVRQRGLAVADVYVDEGLSGKNMDRPELQRLLADAAEHRFDLVLVWKVDRISRSLPFRPQTREDSRGVGYQVYGHGQSLNRELIEEAIDCGRLEVKFDWDDIENKRHVAVNRDSVRLGYVQDEGRRRGRRKLEDEVEDRRRRFDDESWGLRELDDKGAGPARGK